MKKTKVAAAVLALAMAAGITAVPVHAAGGTVLTENTKLWRINRLYRYDKNSDGKLSTSEAKSVKSLSAENCYNSGLSSCLKYFTNLERLECDEAGLTSLDVSKNTKLRYLSCDENRLTKLSVSKNTKLIELSCDDNNISTLDVSKNTKLRELSCEGNRISKLDVSKNRQLVDLSCKRNRITKLNVSKNTYLGELECDRSVTVTGYKNSRYDDDYDYYYDDDYYDDDDDWDDWYDD